MMQFIRIPLAKQVVELLNQHTVLLVATEAKTVHIA